MIDRRTTAPLHRRVASALALRGVRQRELAEVLGLSHWAVSRRVAGHVEWTGQELEEVASYLDVPIAHLYDPAASHAA